MCDLDGILGAAPITSYHRIIWIFVSDELILVTYEVSNEPLGRTGDDLLVKWGYVVFAKVPITKLFQTYPVKR